MNNDIEGTDDGSNNTKSEGTTSNPSVEGAEKSPSDNAETTTAAPSTDDAKDMSFLDLFKAIVAGYGENGNDKGQSMSKKAIQKYLQQEAAKFSCSANYNVLILFDTTRLAKGDADNIYNAITGFLEEKPIILVLFSGGGSAGSAYLIGKLCREYSKGKFSVTVPRYAKSAATLLCCAGNEIHMGSLSELGPIDPQIEELPALGLKNSIEHIAELTKKYPESSNMFAKYLRQSLKLIDIGYYERVAESAWQYAERLLDTHADLLPRKPREISFDLVYKYKDHGFVIDKEEADQIFGSKVIRSNTDEYELGNALYKALEFIRSILNSYGHHFYHIGSLFTDSTIAPFTK